MTRDDIKRIPELTETLLKLFKPGVSFTAIEAQPVIKQWLGRDVTSAMLPVHTRQALSAAARKSPDIVKTGCRWMVKDRRVI